MTVTAASVGTSSSERVPGTIWLIATGIFAMVTSEFMAAGLLPRIADDVGVTVGTASLLISGFAAGQVAGAWLLGLPLSRFRPRVVLPALLVLFATAQIIGLLSAWPVMLGLRVVSGFAMSAYFSIALGTTTRLVPGAAQPRAMAAVFAGVTIGTTLGLPLATFAGQALPWRWAFTIDTALVVLAAAAIVIAMPPVTGAAPARFTELVRPLADRSLWVTFVTAGSAIGGTLVAFSFFAAILEDRTGVETSVVPWLLAVYGIASVLGNWIVGRVTHTGPARVVVVGLLVLLVGLVAFALAPTSLPVVVGALIMIGVTGVSLNAAHTARATAVGGATPAVMTMLPTIITGGILLGTGLGGVVADTFGILAPLWMGVALVIISLATVLPDLRSTRGGTRVLRPAPQECPEAG